MTATPESRSCKEQKEIKTDVETFLEEIPLVDSIKIKDFSGLNKSFNLR